MIGIIGAMGVEIETLKQNTQNKETTIISGIEFTKGTILGKDVVLAVCGVGKVFAAICAQTMILKFAPDIIINTGVAGTLSEKLSIGDIAVSKDVVQHDMDTCALGDPPGLISGINMIKFPADEKAVRILTECVKEEKINYLVGTIASGDKFLASQEEKKRITDTFDAIAGEMEGASIGHTCYVNKTPFLVLRAISDKADGSGAENYFEFLKQAAETAAEVMEKFIKTY
ncbi:MAG: 5'-methylthioadenosine/adenosylhomocysteine nucleosidase [Clostridia bacterium]|nr:5'-methylthioadenosine/adenosylhomocysteine nucleosidase [Clostridia bacterium]